MAQRHKNTDKERLEKIEKNISRSEIFIKVFILVAILTFLLGIWFIWEGYDDFKNSIGGYGRGDFGDYLSGTVGIAFSSAGLALVCMSFLGQKQQLLLQQEELILMRIELIKTEKAISGQNQTDEQQRLENFFFQTLAFIHSSIEQIEWNEKKGKLALEKLAEDYKNGDVKEATCYRMVSSYVKTTFQLLDMIDSDKYLKDEDKKKYYRFAAAQFSQAEFDLLSLLIGSNLLKNSLSDKSRKVYSTHFNNQGLA